GSWILQVAVIRIGVGVGGRWCLPTWSSHLPPSRAPLHLPRLSLWTGDSHAFASSIDPSINLPATCSWPLLDFFLSPASPCSAQIWPA
uniref:Uncharacterized protein n=1 Tax=Aegilops tauschii subsp. strangulata TaxID=200361 RepID=A0A453E3H9_AEGTS